MNHNETVLQKFWDRVFNRPDAPSLLIPNPNPQPTLVSTSSPMGYPGRGYLVPAPAYVNVCAENTGYAVAAIAAFLRVNGFKRGDRAAIMAWNCPEWLLADLGIQSLGGITVPVYPHSTPDQVNYVIKDSGSQFLFSNERAQLEKVAADSGCRPVHFDDIPELLTGVRPLARPNFVHNFLNRPNAAGEGIFWTYIEAELADFARSTAKGRSCGVTREDTATLIYTSGSTGVPKGVVLTHGSFAAACEGMLGAGFDIDPQADVYLSYLPLAHVYERACGAMLCIWTGVPMSFCKVDELGDALKKLHPTLVHGVPAVWRKIKDKIDNTLTHATGVKAKLISWAFAQKQPGLKHWVADRLVFSKIRKELGGRIRLCTSGGAPISPEIIEFYSAIGIQLLQGYGLTETTGASFVNRPDGCQDGACNKVGSVGLPIAGLQVRIVPVPGQEDSGEGEIQFFGPTVTVGYWNLPAETKKAFTDDGWFKTGDRGRIDSDGFLFITGRIKRLLKTDGGKYVAPEKIEKAYEADPIVQYIVPVGDGKPFISGLVFVNQQLAGELLTKAGVSVPAGVDAAGFYATHPLVVQAVEAATKNANAKLERWETIKKTHVIGVEATIAAGLLTPTLKIRTEEVLKRYNGEIEAFYRKPNKS